MFQDFDMHPGIARTLGAGEQLQGAPLVLDRVVTGDLAGVFEAGDFGQAPLGIPGAVCRLRQFGWDCSASTTYAGKVNCRCSTLSEPPSGASSLRL